MGILAPSSDERVVGVGTTEETLSVDLADGRTIIVPLAWYPRLLAATSEQRSNWRLCGGGYGIHWPEMDEHLSAEGLLRGAPAPGAGYRTQGDKAQAVMEGASGEDGDEYDFTKGRVEQGKFYAFSQRAKATRLLEPDLAKEFQDSESVNNALREYLRLKRDSA